MDAVDLFETLDRLGCRLRERDGRLVVDGKGWQRHRADIARHRDALLAMARHCDALAAELEALAETDPETGPQLVADEMARRSGSDAARSAHAAGQCWCGNPLGWWAERLRCPVCSAACVRATMAWSRRHILGAVA